MITKLPFGQTGHTSTRIILGVNAKSRSTLSETAKVLELLLESGINHIDTTPMNGNSKKCIGAWMKNHRNAFLLATKTRSRPYEGARKGLPCLFVGTLTVIIALLISGCAPGNSPSFSAPGVPPTPPSSSTQVISISQPDTQSILETTPEITGTSQLIATLFATPVPTSATLAANTHCSPEEFYQYKNLVLPLADEHTIDLYKAQTMETITEQSEILELRNRAAVRLESIRGIQAPPCLQEVHEKITLSFDLLLTAWDLIKAKDYSTATTIVKKSYEEMSIGLARIVILEQK